MHKIKFLVFYLLFFPGCTTMYFQEEIDIELTKIESEVEKSEVEKSEVEKSDTIDENNKDKEISYVDLIANPELIECEETKSFIKKVPEKSLSHKKVVEILGEPQYEATNYKKEQTSIYRKLKEDKFCYIVVITFDKNRQEIKTSILSKIEEKNKREH